MQRYFQANKESIRIKKRSYRTTLVARYHEYINNAKKRKLEFALTKEDCEKCFHVNCFYCNEIIDGLGIDRINSDIGYVVSNIVPCCSTCNFMKHAMSQSVFINHIKKILHNYENNDGQSNI